MGVIMATFLLCLVLISIFKTVVVQHMIPLHSPCKNSVQCAGVSICIKDVCQCPPEYGAYGSSCVFVDKEGHNETSPSAAMTTGPPPSMPLHLQPYDMLPNPPPYPLIPSLPHPPPNKIDKAPPQYANLQWQHSSEETNHVQPDSNTVLLPPPPPALLYAYPGSSCGTRHICVHGSQCHRGYCRCNAGYVQSGFFCIPAPRQQIQPPQPSQQAFTSYNNIQEETYAPMVPNNNQNSNQFQQLSNQIQQNSNPYPQSSNLFEQSKNLYEQSTNQFEQISNQNMFTYLGSNPFNGINNNNNNKNNNNNNKINNNNNHLSMVINVPDPQPPQQNLQTRISQGSLPPVTCPPDKVLMGKHCMPQDFVVGILCIDGNECSGVAICINSVCTCPPGYVWSSSGCSSAFLSASMKLQ